MCGIVYSHSMNGESVKQQVWEQYEKQKSRGTEGFGVFDGKFTVKAAMEKRIKRWFTKADNNPSVVLFHHRFPTSTVNVKRAAHPFNTGDYFGNVKYVLVHNGVIRNPDKLKEAHEKLGITYQSVLHDGSYNDSESLLWDMALTLEGKQDSLDAYGGIAFICLRLVDNQLDKLYFGRNTGRPLNLHRTKDNIMLSSEGDGKETELDTLYTYNYSTNYLTTKRFKVPTYDTVWAKSYKSNYESSNNYTNYCNQNDYMSDGDTDEIAAWNDEDDDYGYDYDYFDTKTQTWETGTAYVATAFEKPDDAQQVRNIVWKYLGNAMGRYSTAYWHLVARQDELAFEEYQTPEIKNENNLLSAAIDILLDDDNYLSETAIHPMWKNTNGGIA